MLNINLKNPFGTHSKLLSHWDEVTSYLKTGDVKGPIFIEANITNDCNLKCEWCFCEHYERDHTKLELNTFREFCKQFKELGGKAITFSGGGEPTFHPQFVEFMNAVVEAGLELALITNGVFRDSYCDEIVKRCKWVRVSLDTADREDFKKMKGVDGVEKAISNIKKMYASWSNTKIGVCCTIGHNHTVSSVEYTIRALKYSCDYIQFRPMLPRVFKGEKFQLVNRKVWDYLTTLNDKMIILSNDKIEDIDTLEQMTTPCEGHFFNPILNADGNVYACMYHPDDSRFVFGNIYKNTLKEIWNSDKRKKVIEWLRSIKDYSCVDCQPCCKLTEINKMIHLLNNSHNLEDRNFL